MKIPDCSKLFFPTRYVQPIGTRMAKIVIVVDCPSQSATTNGPVCGMELKFLSEMLQYAGVNITECYITSVVKNRPPNGECGVLWKDSKCTTQTDYLLESIAALNEELDSLNPNVVITLGQLPFQCLTPYSNLSNWRGSVIWNGKYKIVPTYSPTQIFKNYLWKSPTQADIKKAVIESRTKTYNYIPPECKIYPTKQEVIETLNKILVEKPMISFDVETVGPLVRCLGIGYHPDKAICIPFFTKNKTDIIDLDTVTLHVSGKVSTDDEDTFKTFQIGGDYHSYYTEEEEYEILAKCNEIFKDPGIRKVAQNTQYDVLCLANQFGFEFDNLYMDTLKVHHTLYPELPKDLGFLGSIYTDIPCWFDSLGGDDDIFTYNCLDCVVTLRCAIKFEKLLIQENLSEVYFNHEQPTLVALLEIGTRGLYVDVEERAKLAESCEQKLAESIVELRRIVGDEGFNPASHKQVKQYLYKTLNLPVHTKRNGKGEESETSDAGAIFDLKNKFPQYTPFFDALITHHENAKLLSTYLYQPLSEDNRIFTSFNLAGTVTRRLSAKRYGFTLGDIYPSTNLQNQPREDWFKKIYVAPPGYLFLKADLSQAEFRIVCWLAKINRIIERYTQDPPYVPSDPSHKPFDVHRWVASLVWRTEQENISDTQRSGAKVVVYGGNYMIQAPKLAQKPENNLNVQQASFILTSYLKIIPEIPQWWKTVFEQLSKTRTIISPMGLRRIFMDRIVGPNCETVRNALSHSAQSVVSDLLNRALHLIHHFFDPDECRIICQVHDELDFLCREDCLDKYVPLICAFLQYPLKFVGVEKPLIIPAEVSYGKSWGNKTKYKAKAS